MRVGPYGPFRFNSHFAFSDFENWGGGHNAGFEACVEMCRGKRCVFDVGAHIGLVSLPMSSVLGDGGKVYAFEPADANRNFLLDHIAKNQAKNIEVNGCLVGDNDRNRVQFFELASASGVNSVVVPSNDNAYIVTHKSQITLDTFCAERSLKPEVIKIDVEGSELSVLRGAHQTLEACGPTIFLSVHPRHLGLLGETTEALGALIEGLGYECRNIDGSPAGDLVFGEYLLIHKTRAHKE